jgi:hypothetical protein
VTITTLREAFDAPTRAVVDGSLESDGPLI